MIQLLWKTDSLLQLIVCNKINIYIPYEPEILLLGLHPRKGKISVCKKKKIVQECLWELPGGPVIRTPHFHCRGPCLIPSLRTKILQTVWHK